MVHGLRVCLRALVDSACTSGGRTAHAAGEQRGSRAPTESAPEQRGPVHADGSLPRVRDGPARAVSANVHRTTRTPTHGRLACLAEPQRANGVRANEHPFCTFCARCLKHHCANTSLTGWRKVSNDPDNPCQIALLTTIYCRQPRQNVAAMNLDRRWCRSRDRLRWITFLNFSTIQ